ncbi:acetyl-CoA carboxylase biotin carboxyl carrier protein subunit [Abiotrophia defectiva]
MLRKFKIKVDGKEYLVEMEEIGAVAPAAPVAPAPVAPAPAPAAPVSEPAAEASPAPAAPVSVAPAGADAMPSPMPGTILRILVNVGDTVVENQPLMILEAMKMENEIVASKAGVVSGIHVANGQVVNPGDALITIN